MINSELIWNLLAQSLVKKYNIPGDNNLPLSLKILNEDSLRIFQRHDVTVQVRAMQSKEIIQQQEFFGANIVGYDMILGLLWLIVSKAYVAWETEEFYFFSNTLFALSVREAPANRAIKVDTPNLDLISAITNQAPPDITLVSKVKLYCICKEKRVQAFLVEWRDLHDPEMNWEVANLVGAAITEKDIKIKFSNVVLPKKYSDFADVFDKAKANILPAHSRHDLAIKTEDDKVPLFRPVYDYFKLELDVLHEYIRDMYAKSFIISSKSLFGAPILFTKKKDEGLRLCVDFWGLNVIIKKNKHLLSLMQTLLDMLDRAKRYTKVDIIAAYHALRIQARNK